MKLAFVVDPLDSFKVYKDTTFAIMREAAARGGALYAMEQEDLALRGGTVLGSARRIHLTGEKARWYRAEEPSAVPLRDFDAVLMRKDPPFDMEYVYSTYLLELAESQGARVYNRPRGIRDWNEKLAVARFPQFAPPTLVTRREPLIREFLAEHGDVILKTLDGMRGGPRRAAPSPPARRVSRARSRNAIAKSRTRSGLLSPARDCCWSAST